ncbi:hypothetical protein BGZ51_008372 [Haplosporangium sp. Z 767]|nr:hypothetical protein BGZ51_008372 [Haplosporangium sp. Z 767]
MVLHNSISPPRLLLLLGAVLCLQSVGFTAALVTEETTTLDCQGLDSKGGDHPRQQEQQQQQQQQEKIKKDVQQSKRNKHDKEDDGQIDKSTNKETRKSNIKNDDVSGTMDSYLKDLWKGVVQLRDDPTIQKGIKALTDVAQEHDNPKVLAKIKALKKAVQEQDLGVIQSKIAALKKVLNDPGEEMIQSGVAVLEKLIKEQDGEMIQSGVVALKKIVQEQDMETIQSGLEALTNVVYDAAQNLQFDDEDSIRKRGLAQQSVPSNGPDADLMSNRIEVEVIVVSDKDNDAILETIRVDHLEEVDQKHRDGHHHHHNLPGRGTKPKPFNDDPSTTTTTILMPDAPSDAQASIATPSIVREPGTQELSLVQTFVEISDMEGILSATSMVTATTADASDVASHTPAAAVVELVRDQESGFPASEGPEANTPAENEDKDEEDDYSGGDGQRGDGGQALSQEDIQMGRQRPVVGSEGQILSSTSVPVSQPYLSSGFEKRQTFEAMGVGVTGKAAANGAAAANQRQQHQQQQQQQKQHQQQVQQHHQKQHQQQVQQHHQKQHQQQVQQHQHQQQVQQHQHQQQQHRQKQHQQVAGPKHIAVDDNKNGFKHIKEHNNPAVHQNTHKKVKEQVKEAANQHYPEAQHPNHIVKKKEKQKKVEKKIHAAFDDSALDEINKKKKIEVEAGTDAPAIKKEMSNHKKNQGNPQQQPIDTLSRKGEIAGVNNATSETPPQGENKGTGNEKLKSKDQEQQPQPEAPVTTPNNHNKQPQKPIVVTPKAGDGDPPERAAPDLAANSPNDGTGGYGVVPMFGPAQLDHGNGAAIPRGVLPMWTNLLVIVTAVIVALRF